MVSHSGEGHRGCLPSYDFFENPLLKLMPPMGHLLPHFKMKSSKLKNKPPPLKSEAPLPGSDY